MSGEAVQPSTAVDADQDDEEYPPTPWHLKLLMVGLVLYLGFRLVQFVIWLADRYL